MVGQFFRYNLTSPRFPAVPYGEKSLQRSGRPGLITVSMSKPTRTEIIPARALHAVLGECLEVTAHNRSGRVGSSCSRPERPRTKAGTDCAMNLLRFRCRETPFCLD